MYDNLFDILQLFYHENYEKIDDFDFVITSLESTGGLSGAVYHFDSLSASNISLDAFYNQLDYIYAYAFWDNSKEFNAYTAVFWSIDDVFSYLSTTGSAVLKFSVATFSEICSYHVLYFFWDYYWYTQSLAGAPTSDVDDVFFSSIFRDLIDSATTLKSSVYSAFDTSLIGGYASLYLFEHPEICGFLNKFEHLYYNDLTTSMFLTYFNTKLYFTIDTSLFFLINLGLVFLVWFYIKVFFLSFFFNPYIDESTNDTDHTVTTLITECEKEISNIDDLIMIFLVLFFIFGLYFLFYGFAQVSTYFNNYSAVYVIFPFLFFFIYVAPVCLLFDFGVYVFVYIRGSGPTSMLVAELLYDLINTFAYFIRVFIQLARILLMLIAAGSLQEFIFYFGIDYRMLVCNDAFLDTLYNVEFNAKSLSLFFFTKLPAFVIYWIYEILHTYFVVTIQTIAFFAMVFWLFFYLFTFFFSESHEIYFKKKRNNYRRAYLEVKSI